jgi:hypothetical protein
MEIVTEWGTLRATFGMSIACTYDRGKGNLEEQVGAVEWPTPNASALTSDTTLTCSGDGREKPNKLGWAVAVEPDATAVSQDEANATLWATPRAEHDSGRHRGIADTLHSQIKEVARDYWLSPTAEDAGRMGSPEWAARWVSGEVIPETQQRLRTQVLAVWPTPSVGDVTGSRTVPAGTTASGRRPDGKKAQIGLQTAVRSDREWSTAHDAKHATCPPAAMNRNSDDLAVQSGASKAAPLNADWVGCLMGFPPGWTDVPAIKNLRPKKQNP